MRQLSRGEENKVAGGGGCEDDETKFIEWALNLKNGVEQPKRDCAPLQWTRTRPPPWMAPSIKALALQIRPLNHTRAENWKARMSLRGKETNEILFLRVREIHDHVLEDVRESWLYRESLFQVSNAYPVERANGRARTRFTNLVTSIAS